MTVEEWLVALEPKLVGAIRQAIHDEVLSWRQSRPDVMKSAVVTDGPNFSQLALDAIRPVLAAHMEESLWGVPSQRLVRLISPEEQR